MRGSLRARRAPMRAQPRHLDDGFLSSRRLRRRALDHADLALSPYDPRQLKAGRVVESPELGLRALAPSAVDEHIDVVRSGAPALERLFDARWVDTLHD